MLTKSMFIRCIVISVLSVLVQNSDSATNLGYRRKSAHFSDVISNRRSDVTAQEQGRGFFGHGKLFLFFLFMLCILLCVLKLDKL